MATKKIAWTTGSGYITLTYEGQGNGSVSVASDINEDFEPRQQTISIATTNGTPVHVTNILVKQAGKSYPAGTEFDFAYTGTVQEITLPKGKYKLQCWGAQGGNVTGTYAIAGSKGGYSEGVLTLAKTTTLYIFVGGKGTNYTSSDTQTSTSAVKGGWNGGGAGVRTSIYNSGDTDGMSFPRGGGGATDISTVTSALSYTSGRTTRDSASLLARCIVAGGGAGASAYRKAVTENVETTTTAWTDTGSISNAATRYESGKGLYFWGSEMLPASPGQVYRVTSMTSSAGIYMITAYDSSGEALKNNTNTEHTCPANTAYVGFKVYANTEGETVAGTLQQKTTTTTITPTTTTTSGKSTTSKQGGGTSGKGQYPGKQSSGGTGGAFGLGASQTASNYRFCGGGGGGGWYGGGTGKSDTSTSYIDYCGGGSGFVNTADNASYRPSGYTGLQLDSGTTTAGNTSHPSTAGGTETGHSGNGYARITVIE